MHYPYGEMSGHQSCKSYFLFVSEISSKDFCCAYLERQNIIFRRIICDLFLIGAINNVQENLYLIITN